MAAMVMMMLMMIAASFLVGCTNAYVEPQGIHVAGKVLCQDCTQGWNEWVHGANPMKDCKVSVTCMDDRKRVVYYGSDLTDEVGQFDIIVNKYINGKKLKPELCAVRLVSSPDPACNVLTEFAGGASGVYLTEPISMYRGLVKYGLGPFYYTSPMCEKPDTSYSDEEDDVNNKQGNKY